MTHLYVNDLKDSKLVSIPFLNDVDSGAVDKFDGNDEVRAYCPKWYKKLARIDP